MTVRCPICSEPRTASAQDALIRYTASPQRFQLDLPAVALANFTPDDHTRLLGLLSQWITMHKPVTVTMGLKQ